VFPVSSHPASSLTVSEQITRFLPFYLPLSIWFSIEWGYNMNSDRVVTTRDLGNKGESKINVIPDNALSFPLPTSRGFTFDQEFCVLRPYNIRGEF
jgi:hypothetical protein